MPDETTPNPPDETPAAAPEGGADAAEPADATASTEAPEASAAAESPGGDDGAAPSSEDTEAMAESLLAQVHEAVSEANARTGQSADAKAGAAPEGSAPVDLPSFDAPMSRPVPADLDLLADVNLNVKIELGRTRLLVDDVLKLGDGAVIELDKLAGDPVDIFVNERHIARGEVLVLNDNFCVRISEIVEPDGRAAG